MHKASLRRVKVWSAPLRLSHWLMAGAGLVLLATGWLLHADLALGGAPADFHYVAGYVLVAALALRLYLLVLGSGAASWRDCLPPPGQWRAALQTLRCYVSFGRFPLPAWYAHNPLWGPVYLAMFAVLALQAATGLAFDEPYRLAGVTLVRVHVAGAVVIGVFTALHVAAVFVHDLSGSGSDTSAMINGHRIFVLPAPGDLPPPGIAGTGASEAAGVQVVRPGDIARPPPEPKPPNGPPAA